MRRYIHGDKKRFWHTLLLFYLVIAFLTPSVHSHDQGHDDGKIHHDLTLRVVAAHDHAVHHAGKWHSENLFAPDANFTDISRHDHNSNQHSHFLENLHLRAKRVARGIEKHKSFLLQAVSSSLAFKKVSCKISNQLSPTLPPSNPEFIFVATDLPPPIV